MRITSGNEKCPNCGSLLVQNPGKRGKMFCDATCRSNYWQKQQRLAKKEADGGLPLPSDFIDTNETGIAILHPNGKKETLVKAVKSNKGKSKAKVTVTDLTKPTGKKVVSDPPPKSNYPIDTTKNNKGKGKESPYLAARRKSKQ